MNQPIIWVHGDCLSPQNPAIQEYPNIPAIWVWDHALIEEWQLSLKRLTFIYECLLELPVEIRRGDVAAEIKKFAQEHNANLVITVDSPSPRFKDICQEIEKNLKLEVLQLQPFFDYDGFIELRSFRSYWKVAEKYVFK
jgi:hypothetical protein